MALTTQGTKKKVCYYYDGKNKVDAAGYFGALCAMYASETCATEIRILFKTRSLERGLLVAGRNDS